MSSELLPEGYSKALAKALPDARDAFALLSKPTLELTDAEVELICADLRRRREQFLQGVQDKPKRQPAKALPDRSDEAKAARTANLLNDIELGDI